jgi:hypothetical protein
MKKSTLSLLATAAFALIPISAFAQDSQQNIQVNHGAAAAVGEGNLINQTTGQYSNQTQLGINDYGYTNPSSQISIQDNTSEAAAIGEGNFVNQNVEQQNYQTNMDANSYLESYPQY